MYRETNFTLPPPNRRSTNTCDSSTDYFSFHKHCSINGRSISADFAWVVSITSQTRHGNRELEAIMIQQTNDKYINGIVHQDTGGRFVAFNSYSVAGLPGTPHHRPD